MQTKKYCKNIWRHTGRRLFCEQIRILNKIMYCGILDVDNEVAMRLYAVSLNRKYDGNDHITHNMPTLLLWAVSYR